MSYQEFYHWLYAMRFPYVHAAMLFAVFFWAFVTFLFGVGKKSARVWMWVNRVLAVCSVAGVLTVTVIMRRSGSEWSISLRLLHIPEEYAAAREYRRMLLMNMLLYTPLGLSLTNAWPTEWPLRRRVTYTLAYGIMVSLVCELLQWLMLCGTTEIDDVAANAAGVLFGAAAAVMAAGLLRLVNGKKKE